MGVFEIVAVVSAIGMILAVIGLVIWWFRN